MVSIMIQAPVNGEELKTHGHGRLLAVAEKVPSFYLARTSLGYLDACALDTFCRTATEEERRLNPLLCRRIHSLAGSTGAYMPLVRISLIAGKPESHKRKVSDAVHRALVETIAIPAQDRFHIITEHSPAEFIYDPEYL